MAKYPLLEKLHAITLARSAAERHDIIFLPDDEWKAAREEIMAYFTDQGQPPFVFAKDGVDIPHFLYKNAPVSPESCRGT
jgi:hypothetical protein